MPAPTRRNLITDVPGLAVGNAEDVVAETGTTVVVPAEPCVAAVDQRGGAPGSRELALLAPENVVARVDAVVLTGGSVFGLDAASGVVEALDEAGRGLEVRGTRVPIVPAAVLFDLARDVWADGTPAVTRPRADYRALGRSALAAAGPAFALGNAGAGFGATAGPLNGGLGSASTIDPETGLTVGALVAANPRGSAVMPGSDTLWAWALEIDGEFGGQPPPAGPIAPDADPLPRPADPAGPGAGGDPASPETAGANTTLAVVATDADLSRVEAMRLAIMAQDGLAMAIHPVHTPFDGDTVFALATGVRVLPEPRPVHLARLGALAARTLARAVGRGVVAAESLPGRPSYRERHGRR